MTMPPVFLELFVLALGILILVLESFAEKQDRKIFAIIGIVGLAIVFLVLQASGPGPSGMASYVVDSAAIFFKKVSVVTTIVVLIMSIDYADTIKRFLPGGSAQSGLGEFFALPILTCAGMMWMSSAIDFILIFVSLELVTISFYVLVAYTRRNAASLEAGVKYLILSALSTGFTVYGITWIYGVTRQTNLTRISGDSAIHSSGQSARPPVWRASRPCRSRVQDCGRSIPVLGSRCLSGCSDADHCISLCWLEVCRVYRAFACRTIVSESPGCRR